VSILISDLTSFSFISIKFECFIKLFDTFFGLKVFEVSFDFVFEHLLFISVVVSLKFDSSGNVLSISQLLNLKFLRQDDDEFLKNDKIVGDAVDLALTFAESTLLSSNFNLFTTLSFSSLCANYYNQ
jgi:hypothetical protein